MGSWSALGKETSSCGRFLPQGRHDSSQPDAIVCDAARDDNEAGPIQNRQIADESHGASSTIGKSPSSTRRYAAQPCAMVLT